MRFFNLLGLYRTYRYNIWRLHSSQSQGLQRCKSITCFPSANCLHTDTHVKASFGFRSHFSLHPVSGGLGTKCPPVIKYNDKAEELCSKASRHTPHLGASRPPPYGDNRARAEVRISDLQGDLVHWAFCAQEQQSQWHILHPS